MKSPVPPYFDLLLQHFVPGQSGRFVHLGHWAQSPGEEDLIQPQAFEQAQARLNEILLGWASLADGQAVLDVGCGLGGTLEVINQHHSNMRLYGVNIDARQLAICEQLQAVNGNRLIWQQADACELPFPNASLDRVICLEAMFHFPSRRQFLQEVNRVLKPGGVFVATDMTVSSSLQGCDAPGFLFETVMQDGYGPWPDFWQREGELDVLIHGSGLTIDQLMDASENTLPSYHFTAPGIDKESQDPGDIAARAALAMHWLHRQGHLRYWYLQATK
ncbi:class I SAM-dependent methyltransferase [Maricurvus nonylphenolicus]|uniref:class I SAM-dependent methyltransferase n=1 Tax=Maricurvus nonylphenolicus TaxID=1008307 RepID=UPI0036F37557